MADTQVKPSADDKSIALSGKKALAVPAGKVIETDPNSWYYLKVNYKDRKGNQTTGYAFTQAYQTIAFGDYITLYGGPTNGTTQFSPQPADDGWQYWKIKDNKYYSGTHLDCKATGFLYQGSGYNTWFKIVDGKLYCSYWSGAAGNDYYSFMVPSEEYLGMGFANVFTCELVKV